MCVMIEEIKQNGKMVLSSSDEIFIHMVYNNPIGKNFSVKEYRQYMQFCSFW